jgi:hypothetical protein
MVPRYRSTARAIDPVRLSDGQVLLTRLWSYSTDRIQKKEGRDEKPNIYWLQNKILWHILFKLPPLQKKRSDQQSSLSLA